MRSLSQLPMVLAAAAALAVPAAAHAATITSDAPGSYIWNDAPGEKNNMSVQRNEAGDVIFFGHEAHVTSAPAGCTPNDMYGDVVMTCPGLTKLVMYLGDNDDSVTLSYDGVDVPTVIDAGPGKDWIRGEKHHDEIHGGPGDDQIEGSQGDDLLDGGDGNDDINAYSGADHVLGGAGDDTLKPDHYEDPSADVVDGGPGIDTIDADYGSRFYEGPPQFLTFTMAGGADDGRPGEGDDLRSIERLTLSTGAKFVGSDESEYVKLHQVAQDGELIGNGGDDELRGGDGQDKIDGGPGADKIDGGFNDDVIVGGPGKDSISADLQLGDCGPLWCKYPWGNDTVDARDGEVDSVTCGAGTDVVKADAVDVVAPDCETVERSGAAPGGGGGQQGGGTQPGGGGGTTVVQPVLKVAGRAKLRTALRSGLKVRVSGAPQGTLKLVARRGKAVVARGSAKVGASGTATVRLTFTAAARKALRGKRMVTLKVSGGGASATATLKR